MQVSPGKTDYKTKLYVIFYFVNFLSSSSHSSSPSVVHLSNMELVIYAAVIKVTFHKQHKNLKGACDAYDYHRYLKIPSMHTNTTQKV